jgi:ribosome-associated protein
MEIRRPRSRRGGKQGASAPQRAAQQRTVMLREEFITLGQLLKVVGVIGSGGEAKAYLADTVVQVNGEPEQRRGRKLRPGDVIVPPGEDTIVLRADADADAPGDEA